MSKSLGSHHGLNELRDGEAKLAEFKRYLALHADRDVLFSAEGMTGWLRSPERRPSFFRLIEVAAEVATVRCVWTMRRFDQWLTSVYLFLLAVGRSPGRPEPFFERMLSFLPGSLFESLAALENTVDVEVAYVRYESDGSHYSRLLGAFGVANRAARPISEELRHGTPFRPSITHKQAVALVDPRAIGQSIGMDLDHASLRRILLENDFEFEHDRRCEPVEEAIASSAHERALAAARANGIGAYVDFFGAEVVRAPSSPGLDLSVLASCDLERLRRAARTQRSAAS